MAFDDTFEDLPEEDFDIADADQDELEEYGVWVTGEPEDITSFDETDADSNEGMQDIDDFSDETELSDMDTELSFDTDDSAISEEEETLLQDIAENGSDSPETEEEDQLDDLSFSVEDLDGSDDEIELTTPSPEDSDIAVSDTNEPEVTEHKSNDEIETLDLDSFDDHTPQPSSAEKKPAEETLHEDSDTSEISLDDFFDEEPEPAADSQSYIDEDDDEEDEFLDIDIDFDEDPYELPPEIELQKPQTNYSDSDEDTDTKVGEEIDLDDFFDTDSQDMESAESLDSETTGTELERTQEAEEPAVADAFPADEETPDFHNTENIPDMPEFDSSAFELEEDEDSTESYTTQDISLDQDDLVIPDETDNEEADSAATEPEPEAEIEAQHDFTPDDLDIEITEEPYINPPIEDQDDEYLRQSEDEEEEPQVPVRNTDLTTEAGQKQAAVHAESFSGIEKELHSIREELAALKQELAYMRAPQQAAAPEPQAASEPETAAPEAYEPETPPVPESADFDEEMEDDGQGFFEDDEDETIALTGDELDNILNTAEFTQQTGTSVEPEYDTESDEDEEIIEIPTEESESTAVEEPADSEEELESGYTYEDTESLETDQEEPVQEITLEPLDHEEDEEDTEDEFDIDEGSSELDFTTDDDEDAIESMASLDIDDELDDIDSYKAEYDSEDDLHEELDELEIDEPETDAEPTADETTAETEAAEVPAEKPQDNDEEDDLPAGLREEIRSILSYMDQLLESLPEEKIQEFARSEHFAVYKRLFDELGL